MAEYSWKEDWPDEEKLKIFKQMKSDGNTSIEDLSESLYDYGFRSKNIDTIQRVLDLSDDQAEKTADDLNNYEQNDRAEAQELYDMGWLTRIDEDGRLIATHPDLGDDAELFYPVREYLLELQ
ncbi:hypothetical protein [Galactobacillus timonensis]|uniref:hypothetical protein n=1 Tax=Galactobacillus timonensis TaxID=2041840 RepID=UPI000C85DA62|nr:hypothetical protein [Galactobacillus timonensis]